MSPMGFDPGTSPIVSHRSPPLKEIPTNAVSRGGCEPTEVTTTLGRGVLPLQMQLFCTKKGLQKDHQQAIQQNLNIYLLDD